MPTPNGLKLPRKFAIYLLWIYVFMGIVSMLAGGYLSYNSYQMRVAGNTHGTFFVMLVGGVIAAFGVWRCVLAFYHLHRVRAGRR
jgi:hypothetical protein